MSYTLKRSIIIITALCLLMAFMPSVNIDGQVLAKSKKPGKVSSLTLSQANQTVTVKWKKAKNAKSYQVNVQLQKGKKWKSHLTLKTSARSALFKGTSGKTYRVKVRATAKKKGKWSSWKKIKIKTPSKPTPAPAYDLEYWTKDSPTAASLRAYVKDVTNPSSKNFVPEKDRVVTFDMDGTFLGERYPTYFDTCLFMYRVLDDPDYKDKAPQELREMAQNIRDTGQISYDMDELADAFAKSYAGMTLDEFKAYVKAFSKHEPEGFDNLTYETSFYKPMLSVIRYLEENHFQVYVVTGTERITARALMDGVLDDLVPFERLIGSNFTMVATHQGDVDGLVYDITSDDDLLMGDSLIIKCLRTNKVTAIQREIGRQPILAFGNSSSDFSMAQYALNNKKYKGRAYMLLCDDTTRDYGDVDVAAKFKASCEEHGFYTVSMKNEFTTIYGDNAKLNPDKRRPTTPSR